MNLIQSLQNPKAYPHSVSKIEVIETHISWVLLTGEYAYKIKKPVQFDFLDFSTLEKRRFYCEEELRLNRRFAPNLYLQVVPITGMFEKPKMNGTGEVIEYALQMRQFPANQLLTNLVLNADIIDQLADIVAKINQDANVDISESSYGTISEIEHWFSGNFVDIRGLVKNEKFLAQLERLENWGKQELANNAKLIKERKQNGFVRECHGDLHLGNIVLFENHITPFDSIEFNPTLRWLDVINEVAFVMMDLEQLGFKSFAYRFLNRYLSHNGDYFGLGVLRYYLVYRALVRMKVALLRWQQHQNSQDFLEAENYANLAENFCTFKPPFLLITHGYSGSGKSTFSAELAEKFGIIVARSDVERKRLFSQDCYSPEHTRQTYQKLADIAQTSLNAGFPILIDATFLQLEQRNLFQQLATAQNVKFFILDFQATQAELTRRIQQRNQIGNDISEATLAVLEQQIKTAQPLTESEQPHVIQVKNITNTLQKLLHHL